MQRAQEIQKADPKVAYYCRLYGVEQVRSARPQRSIWSSFLCSTSYVTHLLTTCDAITSHAQAPKIEKRAKEINGLLVSAMGQMEKEKPHLALDKENDRCACMRMGDTGATAQGLVWQAKLGSRQQADTYNGPGRYKP